MKTYENILDEAAENIKDIQKKNTPHDFALEISKKYGIDYKCQLDHNHKYSSYSK